MTKTIRSALLAAAPASATPAHTAPPYAAPGNWLYLTVTTGESRAPVSRGTLLMCDTPQRNRRAAAACAQLRTVRGNIGRIPHRKVMCPMHYEPITASARGLWNGRVINYRKQFGNRCELEAKTGAVFTVAR